MTLCRICGAEIAVSNATGRWVHLWVDTTGEHHAVPRETWSDLDWALFFLDNAEMSLSVEFGAKTRPQVREFLLKHHDRIAELRREYAIGRG